MRPTNLYFKSDVMLLTRLSILDNKVNVYDALPSR